MFFPNGDPLLWSDHLLRLPFLADPRAHTVKAMEATFERVPSVGADESTMVDTWGVDTVKASVPRSCENSLSMYDLLSATRTTMNAG